MKVRKMLPVVLCCLMVVGVSLAKKDKDCTTLQDCVPTYSVGHYLADEPIPLGFDPYGYNYQGHMFNGSYANAYLGRDKLPPYEGDDDAYYQRLVNEEIADDVAEAQAILAGKWYWPGRDVHLAMKWNDAWLSNKDCDNDGALDRHYGFDSYIGSGAWLTNHQSGEYEDPEGNTVKWNYFVKIVAVPEDAYDDDPDNSNSGTWYATDETEIGPEIWGAFAIIQQVENDPGLGFHGVQYVSPSGAGFGQFAP